MRGGASGAMTGSLLRTISCMVGAGRRDDRRQGGARERSKKEASRHSKDKLWKTFAEVAVEEQEFLKKYFSSQEQAKFSSVTHMENNTKKETTSETMIKARKERQCILDIYDKALAKLPKIASYRNLSREAATEMKNEDIKLSSSTCSQIPEILQAHKEIYYNSEFQDHLSVSFIHNRPLPPIPQ